MGGRSFLLCPSTVEAGNSQTVSHSLQESVMMERERKMHLARICFARIICATHMVMIAESFRAQVEQHRYSKIRREAEE